MKVLNLSPFHLLETCVFRFVEIFFWLALNPLRIFGFREITVSHFFNELSSDE